MRIHEIDRDKLIPHDKAFNPSIIRWQDKTLMAYRVEYSKNDSWAKLAICELDENWQPIPKTNQYLDIPRPHPHSGLFEDPRLFIWGASLGLSFIAATLSERGHVACQGVAKLKDGALTGINYPVQGNNHNFAFDGREDYRIEKNWIFGCGDVVYSLNPLIVHLITGHARSLADLHYPGGRLSGSTPLVPYGDNLIGMFHNFTHGHENRRNYTAGWYVIDPKTWRMVAISKEPFMVAQDGPEDLRPATQQWRPNVIFPCGLIDLGDEFAVSYGWQDSRCRIAFCSKEEVAANLIPVTKHFVEKKRLLDPYQGIAGGFVIEHNGQRFQGRTWNRLKQQTDAMGIPVQVLHDQLVPKVPQEMTKIEWVEDKI